MKLDRVLTFCLLTFAFCLLPLRGPAQEPTAERLIKADKEPQNWLTYFGAYNAWRYSALDQINRTNVKSRSRRGPSRPASSKAD